MEAEKEPSEQQRQLPEAPATGPGWEAGWRGSEELHQEGG